MSLSKMHFHILQDLVALTKGYRKPKIIELFGQVYVAALDDEKISFKLEGAEKEAFIEGFAEMLMNQRSRSLMCERQQRYKSKKCQSIRT